MKRILPFLLILVVLGVALVSAWYLTRTIPASPSTTVVTAPPSSSGSSSNGSAPANGTSGQPIEHRGVPGAEPAHTLGSPNSTVRLEEFGDFQCPPCGLFHPILEQMRKEFGDRLHITFREYPLVPAHQNALAAASAAEAAGLQGKFWEMHNLIYEHQADWKDLVDVRPVFEGYAIRIGLDLDRYKTDVSSNVVAQRIFLDGKRGHSMGVGGTPTVFLNGKEVPFESLQPEKLRVIIQNEMNATGSR
jgi:protein-disulfide isomerase